MTTTQLFKKYLKQTKQEGKDDTYCDHLAGCIRKIVLSEAEAEAGKRAFKHMMERKLWNDPEFDTERGWLFGSPETNLNIGLVPSRLAAQRMALYPDSKVYSIVI